jgi:Co/Zn/Cd efflux system component
VSAASTVVTDLRLWRLRPGHLGAIVAIATEKHQEAKCYRRTFSRFGDLSHVTIEVNG